MYELWSPKPRDLCHVPGRDIPHNNLSTFLENRVTNFFIRKKLDSGKAVFAFQEFNNQDVCFFGMHVQEYGSDVPAPNASFVSLHIWSCPPCEGDDYIFNCHPVKQKIPKAKRLQEWYRRLLEKATNENIVSNFTDILSYAVSNDLKNAADMPYFDGDFWPSSLEDNIKEIEKTSQDSKTRTNQKTQNKGKKVLPSTHGDVLVDKIYSTLGKYREMFFVVEFFTPEEAMTLLPICDLDPLMPNDLMHERSSFLVMFRERLAEFSSLRRAKHSTCIMLHEIINNNINSSTNSTNALAGSDARGSISTVSSGVQGGSGSNVVGVGGGDVAAARRFVCSGCGSKEGDFYGCSECETWKSCPACLASLQHIHPTHLISTTTALKKRKIIGASGVDALEHASFCPGGPEGMCYKEGNEEDVARCQKFKSAFTHAPSCENRLDCPSCRTLVRLALLHARKCTFATPCGSNSSSVGTATDGNNNNSTTSTITTITTATEASVTSATNKIANTEQVQPPQQQHITECPVIFCTVARSKLQQLLSKQRKMGERMLKRRTAAMMVNEENDGSASGGSGGGASSSSSAASERVDSRQDFQRMGSM
ncbi:hypothetical protein HELRODRAFT_191127 [Helobdella robusta]|uniref:histone acetyltransferase n=1 Tax=Helobdella robusta TaxID=6412 RepID=T1FSM4_HELRO|nr:hypothetical protein HELRODRAFT_191127 [Helobdella robusta]ESO07301.1 hypothetical protein HELRODRAFT_191127 [Helobdella robusta]